MGSGYPLSVDDQRTLPDGYHGPVYIWDIDKTYLSTHFSSGKGLARIPVEFAVDKLAIPGMPEVLRGLRRGPGPEYACAPLYFVSASPPQLRGVLEHKMLLDGVEYDGITSKDWFRTFLQLRPGRLHEQVGFKLCALLEGKRRRALSTDYLFGDDVEKDPVAYSLYAEMIAGELSTGEADERMEAEGVRGDDRRTVLALLDQLPDERGTVKRIFIHLESKTPPGEIERVGKSITAVDGACQLGLALYQMGLIDQRAASEACRAAASASDSPGSSVEEWIADAVDRGLVSAKRARSLKAVEREGENEGL